MSLLTAVLPSLVRVRDTTFSTIYTTSLSFILWTLALGAVSSMLFGVLLFFIVFCRYVLPLFTEIDCLPPCSGSFHSVAENSSDSIPIRGSYC